jgi:hypothetical protein
VILPVAAAIHWLGADAAVLRSELHLKSVDLTAGRRIAGLALVLVPPLVLAFGLCRLPAAFAAFARGDLFSPKAALGLRAFAAAALASAVLALPTVPAVTWLLTAGEPGGAQLVVQVGTGQLTLALVAALIWVFATVLAAGAALARENAQFV